MTFLTLLSGYYLNRQDTFLDESIVSAGAFIMLIFATILQLHELRTQREDLKLTREEMQNHSKEFNVANNLTSETLIQNKFFELLRLKEEYSSILFEDEVFKNFVINYKSSLHENMCILLMEKMSEDVRNKIIEEYDLERKYTEMLRYASELKKEYFIRQRILMNLKSRNKKTFPNEIIRNYNIVDNQDFMIFYNKSSSETYSSRIGDNLDMVDVQILKPYIKHKSIMQLIGDNENNNNNLIELYAAQLHKDEKETYKILDDSILIIDIYSTFETLS